MGVEPGEVRQQQPRIVAAAQHIGTLRRKPARPRRDPDSALIRQHRQEPHLALRRPGIGTDRH